tara:strand:+ start:368 stop:586 length:219 start_codon:yes stop_codon:yes gene_type:complete
LQVPPQEIEATVNKANDDAKALLKEVAEIAVYGNGITYNECWNMSYEERQIIVDVLTTKADKMSGKKRKEFL